MELFNRIMERLDQSVVEELDARAMKSWRKLIVDLDLESISTR
jgi:hypothetical protein